MPIIPTDETDVAVQAAAPSMIPQTRLSNAVGEGMVAEARASGGLGEAVGGFVTSLGLAYEKRVIEAETSETNVKMEEWRQQQTLRDAKERENVQDFGSGYTERRLEERNKDAEGFIKSLPYRQQERAREMVANYQTSRVGDDANFERRRREEHATNLTKKAVDADSSELARNPDIATAQQMIARREAEIDQMPINPEEKEKRKQAYRDSILNNQNAEAIAKRNGQAASAIATYGAPSAQAGFDTIQKNVTGSVPEAERDTHVAPNGGVGRAGVTPSVARAQLQELGREEGKLNDAELTEWLKKNPAEAQSIGRRHWVEQLERFRTPSGTYDYQGAAIAYRDGPDAARRFIEGGRNMQSLSPETRAYVESFRTNMFGSQPQNLGMQPTGSGPITPQQYFGDGVDVSKLPAGMRNNNPGNLKYSGSDYQKRNFPGMVGPSVNTDQGDPQIVFNSPQAGMAAMGKLAVEKYDGGKRTVNDIIAGQGGWTPGHTEAAKNVARLMGVDPNAPINMRDQATLTKFMRALITQEHGDQGARYSDDLVRSGAQQALGLGAPRSAPGAPPAAAPNMTPRETGYLTPQTPYRGANRYNFSDLKNDGAYGGSAGGQARIDMSVVRVADGIAAALGTKLPVTSAFRSEGYNASVTTSKKSQHSHGNALDLDLKGLTDVQKQAAVRAAVANGATGLGTYPNGSLHIDTRQASGRGPGGLSLWYGHGNGSYENAPPWFKQGVQEGLAASTNSPGAPAQTEAVTPAGPGGAPGTREEGQVPGGSREVPAAPAPGQPPVNVNPPGADIGPGAVAGTAGGGMLQNLPQDPGPFRQQLPGESYDAYARNRAAHDQNRNQIISMRNNADSSALKELGANTKEERDRALAEFSNKLFTGEANRNDIQRALESGLIRDNRELHSMLQAEAQYQSAVDRGIRAHDAQRNADRAAYVEQQKQKSMLGQLEETDVMTDMQAGRITADEASGLINRIRTWKKGQDGGYSAVARVQTGPIGSAYNKEDRDVANTAYDHMVKNSGAKTQQEIDAYSARVAAAIVNKWGFAPDDHVEKLAGQAMTGNAQRTIAAAAEAAQLLRSNPAAFDQAGEAGKTILRVASDYATMLSQGYTDAEMAERIKKMAEPKFAQENADQMKRGGILGDALKGVQEMSADAIAKKIGRGSDGWIFTGSKVGIDDKFLGAVKLTPQSSSALKAEYESIYKRELAMTGDPKLAENRTNTLMSKSYGETKFGGAAAQRGPLFTSQEGTSFTKYPAEKIMGANFPPSTPVATIQNEIERQARDHLVGEGVTVKPDRIVLVPQFSAPRTELIDGKNPNAYAIAYLDRDGNMRLSGKAFFFDANKANSRATQAAASGPSFAGLVRQMDAERAR